MQDTFRSHQVEPNKVKLLVEELMYDDGNVGVHVACLDEVLRILRHSGEVATAPGPRTKPLALTQMMRREFFAELRELLTTISANFHSRSGEGDLRRH
jgi:hypothetical protein